MNMWLLRTTFWNKKIVPKLFFHECATSKIKAFKPRKIWSSFGKVNSCKNLSDSRKAAQTNILYQCNLLFSKVCMLCIHCMLFLYLRFKFSVLRFKGKTNHYYKWMVIKIPQLEKIMFHMKAFYNIMFIMLEILKTSVLTCR